MFPKGGHDRKQYFLIMFPKGGDTGKHCFQAMFPEGEQTRKHYFLAINLLIPIVYSVIVDYASS
jgi:hypothetical protein